MELLTQTASIAALLGLLAFGAALGVALATRRRHVRWQHLLRAGGELMRSPGTYLRPGHLRSFRKLVELGIALWLGALLLLAAFVLRRMVPR
jgi:hypothetical protein